MKFQLFLCSKSNPEPIFLNYIIYTMIFYYRNNSIYIKYISTVLIIFLLSKYSLKKIPRYYNNFCIAGLLFLQFLFFSYINIYIVKQYNRFIITKQKSMNLLQKPILLFTEQNNLEKNL